MECGVGNEETTGGPVTTPHISATPGDFAPAVLMPGDPKRAARMAQELLTDARQVTDVRGMLGFTGTVDGAPVSIMGSGMGQPSAAIYATELFSHFGVRRIIRVGTAGGISTSVGVGDVVIATAAHTDSAINTGRIPATHFAASASFWLTRAAVAAAEASDVPVHVGPIMSTDHFYRVVPGQLEALQGHGVLAVEMEAAALFGVAAEFGGEALAVLTVSDHLVKEIHPLSAGERETQFHRAAQLAVAAATAP